MYRHASLQQMCCLQVHLTGKSLPGLLSPSSFPVSWPSVEPACWLLGRQTSEPRSGRLYPLSLAQMFLQPIAKTDDCLLNDAMKSTALSSNLHHGLLIFRLSVLGICVSEALISAGCYLGSLPTESPPRWQCAKHECKTCCPPSQVLWKIVAKQTYSCRAQS